MHASVLISWMCRWFTNSEALFPQLSALLFNLSHDNNTAQMEQGRRQRYRLPAL